MPLVVLTESKICTLFELQDIGYTLCVSSTISACREQEGVVQRQNNLLISSIWQLHDHISNTYQGFCFIAEWLFGLADCHRFLGSLSRSERSQCVIDP
eukprot:c17930_g2_i1 orf=1-291(-)